MTDELDEAAAGQSINNTHETRETWLLAARRRMEARFFCDEGKRLPSKIACGCGWMRQSSRAIGQCFSASLATDGTTQIWICPTQDEPVSVLVTLLHELGHAQVGVEHGHKKPFKDFVRRVGLAGKATATYAEEGGELHAWLAALAEDLGPYPHKAVRKLRKGGRKTKWVRLMSPSDESYKIVISELMLEEHGPPTDPFGDEMVLAGGR